MQRYPLVVYDKPYCVWEHDLTDRNRQFLERIDPGYFRYLADANSSLLDGDDSQRASVTIRTSYHHGLETLFAIICAVIQSPQCVPAWLQFYKTSQLRRFVADISSGGKSLMNRLALKNLSWHEVAKTIMVGKCDDERRAQETKREFGKLWSRFALDFLDSLQADEYNSIKHGFRAHPGGFQLAAGIEDKPGTPAAPEKMKSIGGSAYGTSFFVAERLSDGNTTKADPNFRIRSVSLNWNPESLVLRLHLIAISIGNVISFARIVNGLSPELATFSRPVDASEFSRPWTTTVGVNSCSIDTIIKADDVTPMTKEQILASYSNEDLMPEA
jgi:regulator of extracellular matrix RemA (YlzA/DUF370 family)